MFRRPFKDPMQMRTENKQKIWLGEAAFQSVDSQSVTIQNEDINSLPPTDKVYGLLEVGANVGHVTVLHGDPLVVVVTLGRLQVPA